MKTTLFSVLLGVLIVSGCASKPDAKPTDKTTTEAQPPTGDTTENATSNDVHSKQKRTTKEIQQLLEFKANIETFIEWTDAEGDHIVFTSKTGVYHTNINKEEDTFNQNAALSCYHYVKKTGSNGYTMLWKIEDYSKDCPFDAIAKFQKNTLSETDLDKDGTREVWVMYYTTCKSDVSPSTLKLIMYEGNTKYKMTGNTKVQVAENEFMGGEITSEGKFKEQPAFLKFATTLWKDNSLESYND